MTCSGGQYIFKNNTLHLYVQNTIRGKFVEVEKHQIPKYLKKIKIIRRTGKFILETPKFTNKSFF